MEKLIKIQAESAYISCDTVVPEKKAVKVLTEIRKNFSHLKARHAAKYSASDKLVVKTAVYNPELF